LATFRQQPLSARRPTRAPYRVHSARAST
jgi:hypothetical protein